MATVIRSMHDLAGLTPKQIRHGIREGRWRRPTSGLAPGYTQANLAVVPRGVAYDFLLFASVTLNPVRSWKCLTLVTRNHGSLRQALTFVLTSRAIACTVTVHSSTRSMTSWPVGEMTSSVFF